MFNFITLLLLFISMLFTGCDSKQELSSGLNEATATMINYWLITANIPSEKVEDANGDVITWKIMVDSRFYKKALNILIKNGFPKRDAHDPLDVFKGSGFVKSPIEEEIRYQVLLEEKISSAISMMDGVISARVYISVFDHWNEKPGKRGVSEHIPVSAAVFLKHNGVLDDPNIQLEARIKSLVQHAIKGLSYNRITVIGDFIATFEIEGNRDEGVTSSYVQYEIDKYRVILGILIFITLAVIIALSWFIFSMFDQFKDNGWKKFVPFFNFLTDAKYNSVDKDNTKGDPNSAANNQNQPKKPDITPSKDLKPPSA